MTELMPEARLTRARMDTAGLLLAAAIGVVAVIGVLAVEAIGAMTAAQPVGLAEAVAEPAASTSGLTAVAPFAIAIGVVLLAGAAVIIGRRRLAARS